MSIKRVTLTPVLVGVESVDPDADDTDDDTEPRRDLRWGLKPTGV